MPKKVKKSVKVKAEKQAKVVYDEQAGEYQKAHMEAVISGCAFLAVFPEGHIVHIPLSEISKVANGPAQ